MLTEGLVALGVLVSSAQNIECDDLPSLLQAMQRAHYASESISDVSHQRSVEQFIKTLDPGKMLLLQDEVARLRRELPRVFATSRKDDCSPLEQAAAKIIQRTADDVKIVKKLLGPKFKLDESIEIEFDAEKRDFPKTEKARTARLRKMVHFQVLNLLLAETKLPVAKKRIIRRYERVAKRIKDRRSPVRLPELYAEAFASGLDPHSSFLSAETLADFQISLRLSLEGIGALLRSEDGFIVVQSIVPGGQADKEGSLQPDDKILAVAQEDEEPVQIIEMDIRDAVKLIRGPKGTKVILTVRRAGKGTFKIEIIRDKIDVKDRAAKITYEKRKTGGKEQLVGVLNLPSYYGGDGGRSSYEDVKALLEEAKQKKVDALVLDLSQNGGGLLSEAVRISGLFLRSGAIVATQSFDGETEVLNDEDTETTYSGPLVVLISQASASAAEISAGALQDYRRAVIAGGKNSFGKGTVQQLSGLPGGRGAIKLTTGMFFLPSGLSTQQRGVPAHILIPNVFDGSDRGEKDLDFSLSPTRTPPFVSSTANDRNPTFHWQPVSENITKTLAAKSKARVAKDKNLQDIVSQTKEREERPTRLSLKEIREEADKEDRDGEDAKAEFERKSKAFVDEGVNIAADLASLNPKVKAALR